MPSRNCNARPVSWRISNDKRVNDLTDPWAMLAFTWMIPSADNVGRLEGDPDIVASMIFPRQRDVIPPERMEEILLQLHNSGLVFWYEISGEKFLQFPASSWKKHQKLVGNMKAESDFPEPPEDEFRTWYEVKRNKNIPVNTSINEYKPVRSEEKGREEKRREDEEKTRARVDHNYVISVGGNDFASVVDAFNQNIHPITPVEAEKLRAWLEEGLEPGVLIFAIEQAALEGKRTASYINGILINLHSEGVSTRAQAEARERDRIQQKRRRKPPDLIQQPRAPAPKVLTTEEKRRIQEADKLIAQLSEGMVMPDE